MKLTLRHCGQWLMSSRMMVQQKSIVLITACTCVLALMWMFTSPLSNSLDGCQASSDPRFTRTIPSASPLHLHLGLGLPADIQHVSKADITMNITQKYKHKPIKDRGSRILILQWGTFYGGNTPIGTMKIGKDSFKNCKYSNCEYTLDRSKLKQSEALMFHYRPYGIPLDFSLSDLPPQRKANQKWIFVQLEPFPRYAKPARKQRNMLKNMFNMTLTYRKDSEIYIPHGYFKKVKRTQSERQKIKAETQQSFKNRTKLAFAVISNCNNAYSKRLNVIRELQKYLDIDIYGKCGKEKKKCPSNPHNSKDLCTHFLGKKYKFILSFENSDCLDYTTDRLWENAYLSNLVPIVRGRKIGYQNQLPDQTFVHLDRFSTLKIFADYLKSVGADEKMYTRLMNWKEEYDIGRNPYYANYACRLCESLTKQRHQVTTYPDIVQWLDKCFYYA